MSDFMFTVEKDFRFEAAHLLEFHDGKCARLHGHSYILTVVIEGYDLEKPSSTHIHNPKTNMLIDFDTIKRVVAPFVDEYLDHHFLNETLKNDSPTSEYIASFCFGYLSNEFYKLPLPVRLAEIRISETCTARAIYKRVDAINHIKANADLVEHNLQIETEEMP